MSTAQEDSLRSQVFELAESCLQGTGTARQIAQLDELLKTDHRARKYYLEFVQDSYSLRIWALAQEERQEAEQQPSDLPSSEPFDPLAPHSLGPARQYPAHAHRYRADRIASGQNKRVLGTLVVAACMAAVVLIAIRVFPGLGPDGSSFANRPVVASIVDASDCVWNGDLQFTSGAPLRETQQLQLAGGMARIRFGDGAIVTLEGPSDLQLLSSGGARLKSGTLTSYVPPQAVGFQVQTAALNVVDLGTSFGVTATADDETSVSVFSGQVEVSVPDSENTSKKIVTRGESVRARKEQASIETTEFDALPFSEPLKATMGIVTTDGDCRFIAEQAIAAALPTNNNQILIAVEQLDFVLPIDLTVDHVPNPSGEGMSTGKDNPITAGTQVDCFLVQFRPDPDAIPKQGARASGRITFERPIVGIISKSAKMKRTDTLFAGGPTTIEQRFRGGETGVNVNSREKDAAGISDDRRTLEVSAQVFKNMDQVRVLVDRVD